MRHKFWMWGYYLLWSVLLAIYVMLPWSHIMEYAWDYDEGPQLQAAALAYHGYPLYSEVSLNKPPLLTRLLEVAFHFSDLNLRAARTMILCLTTIGFLALGGVTELWGGLGAGLIALTLYLSLPETLPRAFVVMNDLPAMAAFLTMLVAATRFYLTSRQLWLILAALAYSITLELHPLLAPLGIAVVPLLLPSDQTAPHPPFRARWQAVIRFGLIGGGVSLAALLLTNGHAAYWIWKYNSNPIVSHTTSSNVMWHMMTRYLTRHFWLFLIAGMSCVLLRKHSQYRRYIEVLALWQIAIVVTLSLLKLPRDHYLLLMLYPMLIVVGLGGAESAHLLLTRSQTSSRRNKLAVLILVGTAWFAGQQMAKPRIWPRWSQDLQAAKATLFQTVPPDEFIIGDDQFLIFTSGHLVPPSLADTSYKRVASGHLKLEDLIGISLSEQVHTFVLRTGRLASIPRLSPWLNSAAEQQRNFGDTQIYHLTYPLLTHKLDSTLGTDIHLRGYTLSSPVPRPGDMLTVTLYWESSAPLATSLTVFVHVVNAEGQLVAQHDGPPMLGWYPTNMWRPNVIIPDQHPVRLSKDMPNGIYRIYVGMYARPSLSRLPTYHSNGTRWADDRIELVIREHDG